MYAPHSSIPLLSNHPLLPPSPLVFSPFLYPPLLSFLLPPQVGQLLEDQRRINVALTRAKHKLIMIGSQSTLQSSPVIRELLTIVAQKGWGTSATPF